MIFRFRLMWSRFTGATAVLMLSLVLHVSCTPVKGANAPGASSGAMPPAPVRIAVAEQTTVPVQVEAVGVVEAFSTVEIKSRVPGELVHIGFNEGDEVVEGQVLFEIDPRAFQVALRQREAELARAEAALKQAKANQIESVAREKYASAQFARAKALLESGTATEEDFDAAKSAADAARASLAASDAAIGSATQAIEMAKAAIEDAKLRLEYCTIKAPVNGRTGTLQVHKGDLIEAAGDNPMVTITQRKPIYATFTVPEKYLADIRSRMASATLPVQALAPGANTPPSSGVLSMIDNTVDRTTGTIRLKATFENNDDLLWPGQFVDLTMQLDERPNAITVPEQAVQSGQSGPYLYVLKPDNTVDLRNVVVEARVNGVAIVSSGVDAGESVVIDGQLRLAPGAPARVIASTTESEAAAS